MAKFELSIYNENDDVIKTYQRNKCPVDLFLKFQQYSEKVTGEKVKSDKEFFAGLKDLFLEFFPAMTEKEYTNNTDVAEIIVLFNTIIRKATQFTAEKNV
jgi:hypothetical protein